MIEKQNRMEKYVAEWAWRHEANNSVYFTMKWRAETLRPGLEVEIFKPRFESGFIECIFWWTIPFFPVMVGVFWKRE